MPTKIISIDDSKTVRLIVARALRNYDCTLFEAGNGEEGLVVIERERPDLIVLDITMPVMDGVTMLMKVKESEELRRIPVIMLTAESGKDNVQYIAQLGVHDYLVKPFREDQFIEKVSRAVGLQKKAAPPVEQTSISAK